MDAPYIDGCNRDDTGYFQHPLLTHLIFLKPLATHTFDMTSKE
jgi:hypothetical protein